MRHCSWRFITGGSLILMLSMSTTGIQLSLINNFLVGSCSCYSTFFSSSLLLLTTSRRELFLLFYVFFFLFFLLLLFALFQNFKTLLHENYKRYQKNVFTESLELHECCLECSFHDQFSSGFQDITKMWFKFVFSVPENWLIRFSWNFFSRYLGHMSSAERSLIEISWKLWSTEFFAKCVRPVFMTFFCKNKEEKIVQTWNVVHI